MGGEWFPTRLRDIIHIRHGFAFKGEYFTDEVSKDVLLTPGNFAIGGGFQNNKLKYYRGPVPTDFILEAGDLIVTMTDLSKAGDTLGYPALIPRSSIHRYLHNQRLGLVEIHNDIVDREFLYYRLRNSDYRHHILATATGSTVRHTSPSRILDFTLFLPPLPEQRAIAAVLGALDDKIELNRRMNATLEGMARALFQSWFVDFDPVRAKMDGRPTGLPAELSALFPGEMEMGEDGVERPLGWEVKPLDEIATYLNGLALQKYPATGADFLPVIKIAQLRKGNTDGADRANPDIPSDYIIDDGDILFSWSGSLEVVIWCGGRGALNQHLFKVASNEFPKWYYYLWTKEHLTDFQEIAAGKATTMGHIQRKHLTQAKAFVPPSELIKAMDNHMSPIIERIVTCNVESRTLAALRDGLLPKLMNGEVRVPLAEQAVTDAL